MPISANDRKIIRDAAKRVAEIAALPIQQERIALWRAAGDLKPIRPCVRASQQPWHELIGTLIKLECTDELARGIEASLKLTILRHEIVPDDTPILNEWNVGIHHSNDGYDDYGVKLLTTSPNGDGAYHIEPVINSLADMEKLHFRPIKFDHAATQKDYEFFHELFGDILKVQKIGRMFWRHALSRVLIHMRGLDNMMLDMYDNPDLIHALMAFLRDDYMNELDLFERENAISQNTGPCTGGGSGGFTTTSSLPAHGFDPSRVRFKDCYCWTESQECVGVGPKQFDEFILEYQVPLMNRFGLVDYGCCEPLEQKLDVLIKKVPHMRWVAVSPWSDRKINAEKLGDKYVYVYKPNPSHICSITPSWEEAEKVIRETLDIARGCPMHIVMKDTKTFHGDASRTTRWSEMAMRLAKESVK